VGATSQSENRHATRTGPRYSRYFTLIYHRHRRTILSSPPHLTRMKEYSFLNGASGRKTAPRRMIVASSSASSSDKRHSKSTPEFLHQLFVLLHDPANANIISWCVPTHNEHDGGGLRGIGKIVCHNPKALQKSILGKYYRHSKYASFQRQLNYFGFKKRMHDGKKAKLSPCSYIHESLTEDVKSLFTLKRRQHTKKSQQRQSEENEEVDTISTEESTTCSSSTCNDEHELLLSDEPAHEPTLFEILSTPLPPSHILFNDAEDFIANGLSFPYYNNVDSALVDLAMIY
jgi:hypothetical protein